MTYRSETSCFAREARCARRSPFTRSSLSGLGRARPFALLALLGCADEMALNEASRASFDAGDGDTTATQVPEPVRIDVLPSNVLRDDGSFRVLPQTMGPWELGAGIVDLGSLTLREPVEVSGVVTAEQVTPETSGAELPTTFGPIPATVLLRQLDSIQSYQTEASDDGEFATFVIPGQRYEFHAIPLDPEVPVYSGTLVPTSDTFEDIRIDYGAAIYGVVHDGGFPLADVPVYAETPDGVRSEPAFTDGDGFYVLRVAPGTYRVVSLGQREGVDPIITSGELEVTEDGLVADFAYPGSERVVVSGSVSTLTGASLDGVTVRLVSRDLDGYEDVDDYLEVRDTTNNGLFTAVVRPGIYEISILPPEGDGAASQATPIQLEPLVVDRDLNLGNLELPSLTTLEGVVRSPDGETIAEARVSCEEILFERRKWSTYSRGDGSYTLDLSQTEMECTLTPPGGAHLALTRQRVDPTEAAEADLSFRPGSRIAGILLVGTEVEPFAVVEARTASGTLLGSALTLDDGSFSLFVDGG